MTVRVVVPPENEPLTLAEAKLHLREDGDDQDDLITALIQGAREYAERYTSRALIEQTLELTLPSFCDLIELPRPPLIEVEYVEYTDVDGVIQTVAEEVYQVDTYRQPGRIAPAYNQSWPATRSGDFNAVAIRYKAGYASTCAGDPASGVPATIKQWMRIRIAQLYEHREAIVTGTIVAQIPSDFVDGLLDSYRVGLLS